jgi:RNA polymerase sigma-70 factor (ECF subfamily)
VDPVASGVGSDPAVVVGERFETADVVRCLREWLSDAQAEVVLLRVMVGLSVDEVAITVGRSPKAVSMLHRRALERLGEVLSSREGGDP